MTPGILAQSVVFIAIFYGIPIIWERDLGLLQKFLITPTPRIALVSDKKAAAGIRGHKPGFDYYCRRSIDAYPITSYLPWFIRSCYYHHAGCSFFCRFVDDHSIDCQNP